MFSAEFQRADLGLAQPIELKIKLVLAVRLNAIPFNGLENKTKKCDIPAYRHHTG